MDKHRKHWFSRAASFCLLLSFLGSSGFGTFSDKQSAWAQAESGRRTRLARPGYVRSAEEEEALNESYKMSPSIIPPDGRPFALGVEHRQIAPDTLSGGLGSPPVTAPSLKKLTGSSVLDAPDPLKSQSGIFDKPVNSMFALQDSRNLLKGNLEKRTADLPTLSVQLLSNFDLELIVDSSLSMRRTDCPNFLSRWEWCGLQTKELSRALVPYVPKGFTLTSFASEYHVYPNSSPSRINDLFENPAFMWGTKLAEPLQDRLANFFARRQTGSKPMLIAVITDGVPSPRYEPMLVVQTLVNATKRMRDASEVTVVFFQIGGSDEKGRRFLSELDYNLVKYGARFDIVRTVSFEHLQKVGLAQALVQNVQDFAKRNAKP
jgi:hypothetical protein